MRRCQGRLYPLDSGSSLRTLWLKLDITFMKKREAQLETSEGTEECTVFSTDLTIRPF